MDDIKRLIERYKQELMEYNRSAASSTPIQKMTFPEMVEEPAENVTEQFEPSAQPSEEISEDFSFEYFPDVSEGEDGDERQDDMADNNDSVDVEAAEYSEQYVGGVPESGRDIDEQLANRPFEPEEDLTNSREDIKPLVQNGTPEAPYIEPMYEDIEEFYDANPHRGLLKFTAYTASGALPVPDARVVVYKTIAGRDNAFYTYITDISGQTPEMRLPAPSSGLSQIPDSEMQPYSLYDAFVSAKGYNDVLIRDIAVFDGITSIQRVAMVPSAGAAQLSEQTSFTSEVSDARE